jgi:hypothetical protein
VSTGVRELCRGRPGAGPLEERVVVVLCADGERGFAKWCGCKRELELCSENKPSKGGELARLTQANKQHSTHTRAEGG